MPRDFVYSERKRLMEEGSLGELEEGIPPTFRVAFQHVLTTGAPSAQRGARFGRQLTNVLIEEFGLTGNWQARVKDLPTDRFLDLVEFASAEAAREYVGDPAKGPTFPGFDERIADLMQRHRLGYRLEDGRVRKIGSPVLDEHVVRPALIAVSRQGWEEVEASFLDALDHQRGGEVDEALTAANASVEAALKAAGFRGANLGPLVKDFKKSAAVPPYLREVPELIEQLLGKIMAARSQDGDAHGKAPGSVDPEQPLADVAIYWAGAFIAYLAEATANP